MSRNHAVGKEVLARFFCARTSSFGAYRSMTDMLRPSPGYGPTSAPHSSSCVKICFAINSFPTAWLRLSLRRFFPSVEAGCMVVCILAMLGSSSCLLAQSSTSNSFPVVTVVATTPEATWSGSPGVFTIYRTGNPTPALNVYCCISGSASNGVDYKSIGHFVNLASGVISNTVVIQPINHGQTAIETVVLDLCPSPLMTPVNYSVGSPSEAVVYITPSGTNVPPTVKIVSPTNNEVYHAPVDIGLFAKASDLGATVTNVEFFAGSTDLGPGHELVLDPPGVNGVVGLIFYLDWTNVPPNAYALTAVASDTGGATSVSPVVDIAVLGPGSNLPPVVRITSPPNGEVFRGPMDIPIFAYAADLDGYVTSVQFFANNNSIGFGRHVIGVLPPLPPGALPPVPIVTPTNSWVLVWTNPPPGTNIVLTAEATDNGGLSATSGPVSISILPPLPPPTNRPALVGIVASDPIAIEGTNCWPWLCLAGQVPSWSNWTASSAVFRLMTNCGPKDATFTVFRVGATDEDLTVSYNIGGTATNGVDYVALPGTVLIPAGQRSAAVTIVPIDDGPPDISSAVVLRVAPGTNYLVGCPPAAAAIILDSGSPWRVTGIGPGGIFHICTTGPDGAWFHVEHSPDMVNWTPLCTNQVVNGSVDFIDPDAATQPGQFYRIVPELNSAVQ